MKVRMLAVLSALALAAWLPLQAQQAPPAQAPQTQAPAQTEDASKLQAKHECCCAAKAQPGQDDSATHDHHAMGCCHGKDAAAAKATCCEGKDAKEMSCCAKGGKTDQAAMQCCAGMKDGQCAAKDGKACCKDMSAKNAKGCCSGMSGQCPAHAGAKS